MSELVSLLIGTMILYAIFVHIREYNELIRAKFRFRFFALRDRLAMLVVTGKLAEDSWEYQHIVSTLNFHISAVEKMSIMRVVDLFVSYHTSPKEEQRVKLLSKRIEHKDVAQIVVDYMSVTYDLIKRNSRIQITLIRTVGRLLRSFGSTTLRPSHQVVVNPDRALSAIRSHQSVFEANLAAA